MIVINAESVMMLEKQLIHYVVHVNSMHQFSLGNKFCMCCCFHVCYMSIEEIDVNVEFICKYIIFGDIVREIFELCRLTDDSFSKVNH